MVATGINLRGRCRCGEVLSFPLTPAGYKRVCPRCRSVVRLNVKQREKKSVRRSPPMAVKGGADREQPTVALSPNELAELAQELSTAVVDGDQEAGSGQAQQGWEHGLRACPACGELLGLGSNVCRNCGTENADDPT